MHYVSATKSNNPSCKTSDLAALLGLNVQCDIGTFDRDQTYQSRWALFCANTPIAIKKHGDSGSIANDTSCDAFIAQLTICGKASATCRVTWKTSLALLAGKKIPGLAFSRQHSAVDVCLFCCFHFFLLAEKFACIEQTWQRKTAPHFVPATVPW